MTERNKEKFVILTSAYNCGKYLHDWSDSIINQTYRPIIVSMVDDKSKDNTSKVVSKIESKFKKANIDFRFIQPKKKLYCGGGYNLALQKAKDGMYFGVLDADDMLEPFACEFIAKIYEKNPKVCWIYTQHNKYNRKMERVIKIGFCCHPERRSILLAEKKGKQIYSHWRTFSNRFENYKFVFRKLFEKGLKCCVDKNLGYRLEENGLGMFVDKVCYRFRRRTKKEKSISFFYPLRITKERVIKQAERRRKKTGIVYPIKKYKG